MFCSNLCSTGNGVNDVLPNWLYPSLFIRRWLLSRVWSTLTSPWKISAILRFSGNFCGLCFRRFRLSASRSWISNLLLLSFSFRSASSRRILLLNTIFPCFVPPCSMLILSPYICFNLVSSFCNVEEFSNSSPPVSRRSALYCVLRSLVRNTSSSSIICISIVAERALKASLWILLEKCYQDSSCPFCCPSPVLMDLFDTSLARFWYSTRQIEW